MPALYVGELQTQNYTWRFFGLTVTEVEKLAEATWNKHREQTGAYYTWQQMAESLYIYAAKPGETLTL